MDGVEAEVSGDEDGQNVSETPAVNLHLRSEFSPQCPLKFMFFCIDRSLLTGPPVSRVKKLFPK